MEKYYWNPTREDRIGVCMGIFQEDQVGLEGGRGGFWVGEWEKGSGLGFRCAMWRVSDVD